MKKFIAREILILLSAICISLLCFLGTFGYNFFKDLQIKNLDKHRNSVQRQSDRLNYIFDYKQRNHVWYFENMSREMNFDLSNKIINNEENLWDYTVKANVFGKIDSVNARWNGKWKKEGLTEHFKNIGFSTPQKLNNFIIEKSISPNDSLNHKKSIAIKSNLDNLSNKLKTLNESKLEQYEQKYFGYQSFVILLFLLFGLRYLYYLLKWCILTLKNS
ncbi:hypothetical protein [uncultured Mucilaginibacter sp.]|uniref:hypothetical protein n=1 Tax=uncultured Mucilaginibacter sp. TaxID=797541 RepID=UPI0025D3CC61|nr:hypothetical protein [uncultured Mucilaginibacter sp.]